MTSTIAMENTQMLVGPSSSMQGLSILSSSMGLLKIIGFHPKLAYILRLSQLKNYVTVSA